MSRVKENIIERYLHFIILGVIALVSLCLLFCFVIKSPNTAELRGSKVGPGQIDKEIERQARMLETRLGDDPEPRGRYAERFKEFESLYSMSIKNYEGSYFQLPSSTSASMLAKREYVLPAIPSLTDVKVSLAKSVAFVPVSPVSPEHAYDQVDTKPDDIDFVTVQANFDLTTLAENFEEAFEGASVKNDWRDSELAEVVIAKLQLERQKQLDDGSWGEWEVVPRTKIDQFAEMLSFSENVSELSEGLRVLKLQLMSDQVWHDILQPTAYDIAQADSLWYPPSLIDIYKKQQLELERERMKLEREKQKGGTAKDKTRTRPERRQKTAAPAGGPGMGGPGMGPGAAPANQRPTKQRRERPGRNDKTAKPGRKQVDIDLEYEDLQIPSEIQFNELLGELAVWVHDDSPVPGNSYRYRVKIGAINPVAGFGWCSEESEELTDSVVLWSDYTESTETIQIPPREYIFPIDKTSRGVRIQVAKYELGKWKSHDFMVKKGEKIGGIVEEKIESAEDEDRTSKRKTKTVKTEEYDYSTGAVLVDVRETEGEFTQGKNVRVLQYNEMLYTYDDGETILTLPIKDKFWAADLKTAFREVKKSASKEIVILDSRGSTTRSRPGGSPGFGPGMGPGMQQPGFGPGI